MRYLTLMLLFPTAAMAQQAGWGNVGQQEEKGFSWTDPLWPDFWMAWTPATLMIFVCIYSAIAFIGIIEGLWFKDGIERQGIFGLTTTLGDRLFITEYEVLTKTVVSNTILFPSYRNVIDTLSGLSIGVGSISARLPKATRVEYQFLGKEIDKREALNGCGLFQLDNQLINERIRERINNEINEHEFMLSARDY